MNSHNYLIVIPTNFTSDLHICGKCKTQFTVLSEFLEHKVLQSCLSAAEIEKDTQEKVVGTIPFYDGKALENSIIISNENFKHEENMPSVGSLEINLEDQLHNRGKLLADEEDVADLLANQFSNSKHCAKQSSDGSVDLHLSLDNHTSVIVSENVEQNRIKVKPSSVDKTVNRLKLRTMFHCDVEGCSYKSYMRKDTNRHARVHSGERPFKCLRCGKSYKRSDKLILHERVHKGDKPHKCTLCSYAAVDSGSIVKHMRVHNDERPFKCKLCSYRARDSSQLTVHVRSHTGDSPYLCTYEQCRGAFKTQSDLRRHMAIHSNVKPFTCALCAYKSTFKGGLRIHMEKHHPDGKLADYRCIQCFGVFPTLRKLNFHIQIAHNDQSAKNTSSIKASKLEEKQKQLTGVRVGTLAKTFSCQMCDSAFVCWNSLQAHERFHEKIIRDMKEKSSNGLEERAFNVIEERKELKQAKRDQLTNNRLIERNDSSGGLLDNDAVLDENIRTTADMMATFPLPFPSSRHYLSSNNFFYPDDLPNAQLELT